MRVLDLGSGSYPNARADVLCERELTDNRHRSGGGVVIDRTLVCGDAVALPFRDGAFDFVIASHLAEHVDDPDAFCTELCRVADGGYIETPSPLADVLLHEEYHIWRVSSRRGGLCFAHKRDRRRVAAWLTDRFYGVFYAGADRAGRPSYALPRGRLGRALRRALVVVGGVLNRSGVMTTNVHFSPEKPLRWTIKQQ